MVSTSRTIGWPVKVIHGIVKGLGIIIIAHRCPDVNECEENPQACPDDTECENNIGSYKCVHKAKTMIKVLQDQDYDAEEDVDDDNYPDEDESITKMPNLEVCEKGFRKGVDDECVG